MRTLWWHIQWVLRKRRYGGWIPLKAHRSRSHVTRTSVRGSDYPDWWR